MRRAQMEMIGLVMIVIIIVIGLAIYLQLDRSGIEQARGTSSFVVALAETSVPACGDVPLSRVARACAEHERFCASGDPCVELQQALDTIVRLTLAREGVKYNVSLERTGVQSADGCDASMDRVAAPPIPIVLSSGRTARLVYTLCR